MKKILFLLCLLQGVAIHAQFRIPSDSLKVAKLAAIFSAAVTNSQVELDIWKPYPTTADHRNLAGKMLHEICNGNDSLINMIVSQPGFSAFVVANKESYEELGDLQLIKNELNELRISLCKNLSFLPDTIIRDTLWGDTTYTEIWNPYCRNKAMPELTILFLNHQLTNILIRKPDEE